MKGFPVTLLLLFSFGLFVPGCASDEAQPVRAFKLTLSTNGSDHNMDVVQFRRGNDMMFVAFDDGESRMIQADKPGDPVDGGKIICTGRRDDMPGLLASVLTKWLSQPSM
jgi:hypothetical protein